jgi:peptide-methionine (S)-S-oxide reductase
MQELQRALLGGMKSMKSSISVIWRGLAVATTLIFVSALTIHAEEKVSDDKNTISKPDAALSKATLAGGCFWCVEAVYEQIAGVKNVRSGYIGGHVENPTYEAVCSGTTGHAEAVELEFDPSVVSYEKLLDLFWEMHDPTTLNRQGADIGTQYRSAIFYHDEEQKKLAEASKDKANHSGQFNRPIVTEITKASIFYAAEPYHQDYFRLNPNAGYCRVVIAPKLKKLGLKTKY